MLEPEPRLGSTGEDRRMTWVIVGLKRDADARGMRAEGLYDERLLVVLCVGSGKNSTHKHFFSLRGGEERFSRGDASLLTTRRIA